MNHDHTSGYSPRVLCVLAQFGLSVDELENVERTSRETHAAGLNFVERVRPGTITLISGASGSGKSTLLRKIARRAESLGKRVVGARGSLRHPDRRVIDLLAPADATSAMRMLSRVGLGEAMLAARSVRELSDGQRARLELALAMHQALRTGDRGAIIVADEFTSGLDRPTARALCACLHKAFVRERWPHALVVATAHDDVTSWLGPDTHLRVHVDHSIEELPRRPRALIPIRVRTGDYQDYRRLAGLHYRASRPASLASGGVRVAHVAGMQEPAGVLVVAMPTLNGRWRELAWPGRYQTGDRRADAARLNRELRTIARVIVDPRVRGLGIARRLIRAYLDDPLTPATDAIAAMGAACPMFARAGMTEYRMPPSPRDARLLDALASRGMRETDLMFVAQAAARVRSDAFLRRELDRWVGSSRATRTLGDSVIERVRGAARSLGTPTIAYAHSAGER